ncbi:MAG: GNAT family N-acetyltransferase [Candidatus Brocadia sp.]|nr:GNAT family N-acetyltransferase [Candidatus Brocadia sp.]
MCMKGSSLLRDIPDQLREQLAEQGFSLQDNTFRVSVDDRDEIITWAIEDGKSSVALWHVAHWDSQQLDVRCARIDKIITAEEASLALMFWRELSNHARRAKIDNIFFRAAADNSVAIKGAEDAGFRTIGIYLDFQNEVRGSAMMNKLHNSVRTAEDRDVQDIVNMADFILDDRFHRDGGFPEVGIARLWKTSVYNAVTQWADKVYVYERAGEIAGFIIMTDDSSVTIETKVAVKRIFLISVLPKHRRQGVGKALVQAAIQYCSENTCPYLMVGTQSSNISALSLYQSCGFKVNSVCQELSWWLYGDQ